MDNVQLLVLKPHKKSLAPIKLFSFDYQTTSRFDCSHAFQMRLATALTWVLGESKEHIEEIRLGWSGYCSKDSDILEYPSANEADPWLPQVEVSPWNLPSLCKLRLDARPEVPIDWDSYTPETLSAATEVHIMWSSAEPTILDECKVLVCPKIQNAVLSLN